MSGLKGSKCFRTLRCKSKLTSTGQIDKGLSIETPKGANGLVIWNKNPP